MDAANARLGRKPVLAEAAAFGMEATREGMVMMVLGREERGMDEVAVTRSNDESGDCNGDRRLARSREITSTRHPFAESLAHVDFDT